jgi:surface antigen
VRPSSGTTISPKSPDNGHSGRVTPTRTYETTNGQYCREFQQQAMIGGQSQQIYGTACRPPEGHWQLVGGA